MPANQTPAARLHISTVANYTTDAGHFTHLRAGHIDLLTLISGLTHTYELINTATGERGYTNHTNGRAVLESAARNAAHRVALAQARYALEVAAA